MDGIASLLSVRGPGAVLSLEGGPDVKGGASPIEGDGLGDSRRLIKLRRLRSSPVPVSRRSQLTSGREPAEKRMR